MSKFDLLSSFNTDELLQEIKNRDISEPVSEKDLEDEVSVMSHTECVSIATRYMKSRSAVVLPEFFSHNAEIPDVIGFDKDRSTVIEVKVSRADFLKDMKKSFRKNPNSGMGDTRYYCCPKGLINIFEVPEGWGLLYVYPSGAIRTQKYSSNFKKNIEAELYLLFYYARRAYYAGVHQKILDYRGYDS